MTGIITKFIIIAAFLCSSAVFASIDKTRYITLDEIEPGMEGYALSVYSGTLIEKFSVKVVSVVNDYRPGKNAIFVMGTDERFKHTGPVQGCSGSPVIIDGRIAGALAFGWSFVKDPLYGVTPIDEMLDISDRLDALGSTTGAFTIDTDNINFADICRQISDFVTNRTSYAPTGLKTLDIPILSDLPVSTCDYLGQKYGIKILSAPTSSGSISTFPGKSMPNFEAGSVVSLPLVDGDIKMAAIGTVTDVVGDRVYAFGHAFDAAGAVELPMATGFIHMVVANQISSFKFGQSGQIIGTITNDASTGIYGKIGKQPPMTPLKITVNRSDNPQTKIYNCQIAKHDYYTPYLLQAAIAAAALSQGDVPKEHTINYSCRIGIEGYESIEFSNTSSRRSVSDAIFDTAGAVAVLTGNRFKKLNLTEVDFSIDIIQGESASQISLVETKNIIAKPGQSIDISITTEKIYSRQNTFNTTLELPNDISPGSYQIMIGGAAFYDNFVRSSRQYSMMADDADTLVRVVRDILSKPKNGIYVVMRLSQEGISIGNSPLEGLPISKINSLVSPKRNYNITPIFSWIESRIDTNEIVAGEHQINIIVEN